MFGSTNVNKFARQSRLNLPELSSLPTHPMLVQMLGLAQKNLGKTITLPWKTDVLENSYCLETVIAGSSKDFVGRRGQVDVTEPQWTLFRKKDHESIQLWSHASGDVGLILNLVCSEVTGTNQETVETMTMMNKFGDSHTGLQASTTTTATNTTYSHLPTTEAARAEARPASAHSESMQAMQNVTLAGSLAEIELSGVLQSISICKMTGRLDIQERLNQAEIYFDDGNLVHAVCQSALSLEDVKPMTGDTVLLDVLTWEKGSFFFHRARKTSERTIRRRLEGLLLEGASLRDYYGHLRSVGFTEDSILHKVNDSLSDKDLDEKIQAGVPIDYSLQKKLYHEINGKTKVHSILAKLGMQKTLWAPILFNLMTCELVSLESGKAKKNELDTDSIQIDQALVKEAARNLYRPETGILSYPLILYFLERELARHKIGSSQFSVVVFEIKNKSDPLSNVALQQMAECFDSIKQKFDMLGHFMILEFLIVLPLRSDEEAREFVNNLYAKILQCQLDGVKQPGDLSFVAGVANVPSDQSEMRNLLAAARGAKESCSVSKSLCRTVRESKWEKSREQGDLALAEHKVSEAENHWTQALTEARAFGNDDLRLILSLEQLAGIYMQRGKHAKAESLLSQLIQLKGRRKDANGLDVAQAVGELARCYYLEGKYAEAEPLLLKVVEVYEQHLGKDNPTVATGLYNLASIYHVQQKHSEAETAYKRALELRQNALGANHPDTKKVETNYLNLLKHKDEGNPEVSFITGTWKALDLANNVPADSKEKQSTEEANDESAVNQ